MWTQFIYPRIVSNDRLLLWRRQPFKFHDITSFFYHLSNCDGLRKDAVPSGYSEWAWKIHFGVVMATIFYAWVSLLVLNTLICITIVKTFSIRETDMSRIWWPLPITVLLNFPGLLSWFTYCILLVIHFVSCSVASCNVSKFASVANSYQCLSAQIHFELLNYALSL
jgi:hypothetical protein